MFASVGREPAVESGDALEHVGAAVFEGHVPILDLLREIEDPEGGERHGAGLDGDVQPDDGLGPALDYG